MEKIYYKQWLASLWELPGKAKRMLWERFPEPEEIFRLTREGWEEMLPPSQVKYAMQMQGEAIQRMEKRLTFPGGMEKDAVEAYLKEEYESLGHKGISFVSFDDAGYPKRLREIPDPPFGIYYAGKLPSEVCAVAIIGSRECSEYGRHVANELGRYLGERRIPVISGMARGIDGISQQAALEAGGESYGVLGCGVDVCYPKSNQRLYQTLTERGGILSEYPPGTPPLAYNFPPRNRIVSGLAMAVVVVEAAVKSGTSITVSMALEQGRDVFVVPGRVTDRLSRGCNELIKQGASVYVDPESFLEELEECYLLQCIRPDPKTVRKTPKLPVELQSLWDKLDYVPKTVGELQSVLGDALPVQDLTIKLMELVLAGRAKQVSPGHFCKV